MQERKKAKKRNKEKTKTFSKEHPQGEFWSSEPKVNEPNARLLGDPKDSEVEQPEGLRRVIDRSQTNLILL